MTSSSSSSSSSSLSVTSSQVHYAQFGRCQNIKTGKTRCALSPDDCEPAQNEDGEKWYNALRLKEKGIDEPPCLCEDTLLGACVFVGAPGQHIKYECAPNRKEDYCRPEEDEDNTIFIDPTYDFLPMDPARTNCFCDAFKSSSTAITENIDDDIKKKNLTDIIKDRTRYGACYVPNDSNDYEKKKFFCAYSSDYCTDDHIWIHPNDVPSFFGKEGEYCNCEKTHIGGCVGGFQDFHCGISELDCRTNLFVRPIPLKEEHNHACFLCKETFSVFREEDEIDNANYDEESSYYISIRNIRIGIAVSVIIATAFLIGVFTWRWRRKKHLQQQQSNEDDHNNTAGDAEQYATENTSDEIKLEALSDEKEIL